MEVYVRSCHRFLGLLSLCLTLAAVADPGTISVANVSSTSIQTIDASGNAAYFAWTGGFYPAYALALDTSGNLYAAIGGNTIM